MHFDNFDVLNNSIFTNKFVFVIISNTVKNFYKFLRNYHFPRNPKILLSIGELQMPRY